MSNQLTKPVKGRYALRIVMKGVATVRAVSLLAVVAIVLGLWISYGFVQDSDAVNQDEMESSFATVENDAPSSDQGMDLEDDNKENHLPGIRPTGTQYKMPINHKKIVEASCSIGSWARFIWNTNLQAQSANIS